MEETQFNTIKAIYDKPMGNIILNTDKLKVFPLRSGTRQSCQLSPLLFNIVSEILATALAKKKKNQKTSKMERSKTVIQGDMTPYTENPKHTNKKLYD